jgi:hypothetical protein
MLRRGERGRHHGDMLTRAVLVVMGILLSSTLTSCDGGEDDGSQAPGGGRPQLVFSGTPSQVETQLPARRRESLVHGSYTVCLDEPGKVDVTAVEFESGDLEITKWAVQPGPVPDADGRSEFAGDRRNATLQSRGIEDTELLTRVCDGKRNFYEVVLQLRAGRSSTQGDRVIVRYTSDGREGSLELPERVVVCVKPERPSCM